MVWVFVAWLFCSLLGLIVPGGFVCGLWFWVIVFYF